MLIRLFTSSFCAPCHAARATLAEAIRLVPAATLEETLVTQSPELAEEFGIRSTPTAIFLRADGTEAFRAEGAPTLNQALRALARATEPDPTGAPHTDTTEKSAG